MITFSGRLSAFRHPRYRRYWLGSFASVGGTQLQVMGQGWLLYDLTGSTLMLGYLGAAASIPSIVMTLFGGAVADRLNKQHVLMTTSGIVAALLLMLAFLDFSGTVAAWHIIAIAAVISFTQGFDWPTRQSIFPSLIEREDMMSAVALNSIIWQSSRMILPAVGGLLIAYTATWVVFLVSAAGFIAMLAVIGTMQLTVRKAEMRGSTLNQISEGVGFIVDNRVFLVLISLSFASMFLANTHMQLMPAFADLLNAGETGYGYLMSASGVGSVVGTIVVGSFQNTRHLGRMIFATSFVSGLFIYAFCIAAASTDVISFAYPLATFAVFAASMFNSVFMISQMTVLQLRVPDALRGRVMGIHGITYSLMPLGSLAVGALAALMTTPLAVALGVTVFLIVLGMLAASQHEVREISGEEPSAG